MGWQLVCDRLGDVLPRLLFWNPWQKAFAAHAVGTSPVAACPLRVSQLICHFLLVGVSVQGAQYETDVADIPHMGTLEMVVSPALYATQYDPSQMQLDGNDPKNGTLDMSQVGQFPVTYSEAHTLTPNDVNHHDPPQQPPADFYAPPTKEVYV